MVTYLTLIILNPNTPDIVILNESVKSVVLTEVCCCFNVYMDTCYSSTLLKLMELILQLGYECRLIVLVSGGLGHVHENVVTGLQMSILSILRYR